MIRNKVTEAEVDPDVYRKFGGNKKFTSSDVLPSAKDAASKSYVQSNLTAWSSKAFRFQLNLAFMRPDSAAILVQGDAGISKTAQINAFASAAADFLKKPGGLVKTTDFYENPDMYLSKVEDYYFFLDISGASLSFETIQGIPVTNPAELHNFLDLETKTGKKFLYIRWKTDPWINLVTNPKFEGILFIDEYSATSPDIVGATLKLVQDRLVAGKNLSKRCMVVLACNVNKEMFAHVRDLSPAEMTRVNAGVLVPKTSEIVEYGKVRNTPQEKQLYKIWGVEPPPPGPISQWINDYIEELANKHKLANGWFKMPGYDDASTGQDLPNNTQANIRSLHAAADQLQVVEHIYQQYLKDPKNFELPSDFEGNIYKDIATAISGRLPREIAEDVLERIYQVNELKYEEIMNDLRSLKGTQKLETLPVTGAKDLKYPTGKLHYVLQYLKNKSVNKFWSVLEQEFNVDPEAQKNLLTYTSPADEKVSPKIKKALRDVYVDVYDQLRGLSNESANQLFTLLLNDLKQNPQHPIAHQASDAIKEQHLKALWSLFINGVSDVAEQNNPEFYQRLQKLIEPNIKIKKL